MTNRFLLSFIAWIVAANFFTAPSAIAGTAPAPAAAPNTAVPEEVERRLTGAKTALDEIMSSNDKSIPEELLAKCKAIVIYPRSIKGAFIFGARYGRGVVLKKDDAGKWGPVAFSTLVGGNAGLQIGGQMTDYFLVIMNDRGLKALLSDKITLGADASFAAGPIGRKSAVGTDLTLKSEILTYAHSKGLFGGVSLDGAVLTHDNGANSLYYGKNVTSRDILLGGAVEAQPSSQPLIDALDQYSALWGTTTYENISDVQPGDTPDFQGYVESVDYANNSMTLIDSRPIKDPSQGKVANQTVRVSPKDLALLRLEDEVQIFYDKASPGKQKEAKKVIKLPRQRT